MYSNVLIGSIPGYGKTMMLRVPLLAAALDPRAELWAYELKGSGDLEALGKVAHRYAAGGDDDVLEEVLLSLRDLLAECRRRADKIKRLPKDLRPENKVTPQLANRRGLHPLVVAIDECQELFGNKQFGAEAGELAERIIKLGRAFGVILLLATQRPDKDSLPTGITANVGTRLALRVTDQTTNDMILGTSAYRNGVRATMFGPSDKGVAYLRGAGEPVIVRGFYVDAVQAEKVCDRARALREQAGTLDGYALDRRKHTPRGDDQPSRRRRRGARAWRGRRLERGAVPAPRRAPARHLQRVDSRRARSGAQAARRHDRADRQANRRRGCEPSRHHRSRSDRCPPCPAASRTR